MLGFNPSSSNCEPINKCALNLFYVWVLVSSLYYISFLFSGEVSAAADANLWHKAFKYIFLASFTFIILVTARRYLLAWSMVLFLTLFAGLCLLDREMLYRIDLLLVLLSMFGLLMLLNCLNEHQVGRLVQVIIFSAVLVSFFSFIEIYFLRDVYSDYWRATGGVRSISSLYNPNNMGLYQSAALILLISSDFRTKPKLILACLIVFGLAMSGSRTAWVSLFAVLCFFYLFNSRKLRLTRFLLFCLVGLLFVFLLLAANYFQYLSVPSRLSNYESAFIRFERYYDFFVGFDSSYFFPDWESARAGFVSESGYFTLINYFGLLPLSVLLVLFVFFFKPNVNSRDVLGWKLVFVFYLIAALFENVLNSFPNNQLAFMSAGAFFIPRKEFSSRVVT